MLLILTVWVVFRSTARVDFPQSLDRSCSNMVNSHSFYPQIKIDLEPMEQVRFGKKVFHNPIDIVVYFSQLVHAHFVLVLSSFHVL